MGWAKYYEDNVSICIGRMVVMDSVCEWKKTTSNGLKANHNQQMDFDISYKKVNANKNKVSGRRGLELFFLTVPEAKIRKKLQINGWWWSSSQKCWCNLNTKGNLRYAVDMARRYEARVVVAA